MATDRPTRPPAAGPGLPGYFVLTFAITWSLWAASAALSAPTHTGPFGFRGPLFLLGVFGPGLAALTLTAYRDGHHGVAQLLRGIARWEVGGRWYVFAAGYLLAAKLLAAVILRAATGAWPSFGSTPWYQMLGAVLVSTWVQAGEELGWRGYALPRLARRLGLGGAGLVLGAIWALWHLPLFFMPGSGSDGRSFLQYLLWVMPISVAMAWLYWRTRGSLLLTMLMHASVNNTGPFLPTPAQAPVPAFSLNGPALVWVTTGVTWTLALVLLHRMRGARGHDHP